MSRLPERARRVAFAFPALLARLSRTPGRFPFLFVLCAFAVSRTMRGGLRGAGNTTWPFYGTLAGTYLLKLPVAFLALPGTMPVGVLGLAFTPGIGLGVPAVYAAILLDMYFGAAVNAVRFNSARWRTIAR
jgi:Na+-driven multidrug efflux pump